MRQPRQLPVEIASEPKPALIERTMAPRPAYPSTPLGEWR
jgi:hypothetical protein